MEDYSKKVKTRSVSLGLMLFGIIVIAQQVDTKELLGNYTRFGLGLGTKVQMPDNTPNGANFKVYPVVPFRLD